MASNTFHPEWFSARMAELEAAQQRAKKIKCSRRARACATARVQLMTAMSALFEEADEEERRKLLKTTGTTRRTIGQWQKKAAQPDRWIAELLQEKRSSAA